MQLPAANVLQPLINVFEHVMLFFHDNVGFGWGLSIIAMTIVVRAALVPLTLKQFRSMQKMQKLQPQMKELQAKYKDDKQRLNEEMMKFYRENQVNPLSSCLPLVLQLPVFISLFYMLRHDLRYDICPNVNPPSVAHPKPCGPHGDAGFLFIPDLTNKATGGVLVALIVLYVGSQVASSLLMLTTADKTQRNLMLFLPLIFVTFIINFPAGLIVYWITTNLWTILQQYIVKRTVGPLRPAAAPAGAAAAAPSGGAGNGRGGGLLSRARPPSEEPATVDGRGTTGPPPPSPRKKKKRSGRRR